MSHTNGSTNGFHEGTATDPGPRIIVFGHQADAEAMRAEGFDATFVPDSAKLAMDGVAFMGKPVAIVIRAGVGVEIEAAKRAARGLAGKASEIKVVTGLGWLRGQSCAEWVEFTRGNEGSFVKLLRERIDETDVWKDTPDCDEDDASTLVGWACMRAKEGVESLYRDEDLLRALAKVRSEDQGEYAAIRAILKKRKLAGYSDRTLEAAVKGMAAKIAEENKRRRHESGDIDPIEDIDDPHRLARLYRDQLCMHDDGLMLRTWNDEAHVWSQETGCYRPVPKPEIKAGLSLVTKREFDRINILQLKNFDGDEDKKPAAMHVTGRLLNDTALALDSLTLVKSSMSQPAWLTGNAEWPAEEILAAHNVLLHLPSLIAGKPSTRPTTPLFFSSNALEYDFDPDAPQPAEFLKFLGEIFVGDDQSIECLQEWFGLCLTPDTSQQKILMLIGPKRSGKGTLARILRELIGINNVVNPTLSGLAMNFGVAPLIGKMLAIISDARLSGRTDTATVVERLLAISGEDSQTIDRKHLPSVTLKLPTRFMLISNELPRMKDASGALSGRMILLNLTKSFYGKEDTALTGRLLKELPGILLWAIEGWNRLRLRGHFIQPKSAVEMIEEMENLSSPIGAFLRECCDIGPEYSCTTDELFERWQEWCKANGRERSGDKASFGRDLRAAVPGLTTPQKRDPLTKSRFREFQGVAIKPPEM